MCMPQKKSGNLQSQSDFLFYHKVFLCFDFTKTMGFTYFTLVKDKTNQFLLKNNEKNLFIYLI